MDSNDQQLDQRLGMAQQGGDTWSFHPLFFFPSSPHRWTAITLRKLCIIAPRNTRNTRIGEQAISRGTLAPNVEYITRISRVIRPISKSSRLNSLSRPRANGKFITVIKVFTTPLRALLRRLSVYFEDEEVGPRESREDTNIEEVGS